ncbi:IPT/TIG domain-containing protein [Streptomyces sp. NPDC040750]|uniref:IPT/TIG domain-containing protein n=1 Tax=Streptomyces sp. NPDC040750 TaxID=3154491 RepID=UPI0033C2A303
MIVNAPPYELTGSWPVPPAGPPLLLAAIPPDGPATGGNTVRLVGQNLRDARSVSFGGTPATIIQWGHPGYPDDHWHGPTSAAPAYPGREEGNDGRSGEHSDGGRPGGAYPVLDILVVIAPPHAPGTVQVTVTTPVGTSNPIPYTYVAPPPAPSGISPSSGPTTGGTPFTITGTNLSGVTGVLFNGVPATGVTATATSVTGTTPAGAAGNATVTLISGSGATTVPGGFTYTAPPLPPTAAAILPAVGPSTGGTPFVITGTRLTGVTSVIFGGTPATVLFIDPTGTLLLGLTPAGPGAGGTVSVTVTGPGGSTTVPGGFTYFPALPTPSPTGIVPATGPVAGGTGFTVTGSNLGATVAVLFDGVAATGVTAGATTVTGTTPPHPIGSATVTLVTPFGLVTVPGTFLYV